MKMALFRDPAVDDAITRIKTSLGQSLSDLQVTLASLKRAALDALATDSRRWELYMIPYSRNDHGSLLTLRRSLYGDEEGIAPDSLYLGIPPSVDSPIITHEALNSSGDSYHILAYLLLSRTLGYAEPLPGWSKDLLPVVRLTHETQWKIRYSEEAQARAAAMFLGLGFRLGPTIDAYSFGETGSSARVNNGSRRKALDGKVGITASYLDQKALTSIIADQCHMFGAATITDIIWGEFMKCHQFDTAIPEHRGAMQTAVDDALISVGELLHLLDSAEATASPILVLHLRKSDKANAIQEFSSSGTKQLLKCALSLLEMGHASGVVVIEASSSHITELVPFSASFGRLLPLNLSC